MSTLPGQIHTARKAGGLGTYHAELRSVDAIDFSAGTKLTLRELRRRQSTRTSAGLKKRVARRFSIIGDEQEFRVIVNGNEITPADRDYYDKIRYIWTYGDQEHVTSLCSAAEQHEDRTDDVSCKNLTVTGWLATVRKVRDLKDVDGTSSDRGDNLNRIAIFVRGKLAQDDILTDLSERGVYASYLIGELHVDDLDQYDGPGTGTIEDDDAATSSRQRIVEDDKRYRDLQQIVWKELKHIEQRWKELRSEEGVRSAMSIPAVKKWLEQLPTQHRAKARSWLGRLNQLRVEDVSEQKSLIKHAVLAFEFYRANEDLRQLESVLDADLETILRVFRSLDDVENSLYGQVTRERLHKIDVLRKKIEGNVIERKIQKYLFDHLWLLEPSWERVDASEMMERRMSKLFEKIDAALSESEKLARIDIKYRKTAGQHVIIELKRPDRRIETSEITRQLEKYKTGMSKILGELKRANEPVEFVLLLGKEPNEWSTRDGRERSEAQLRLYNARVVFYDKMLDDAYERYADYRKSRKDVSYLRSVIRDIEDYAPPES